MYKKGDGEFGCYYFHSKRYNDPKEYNYDKSKEFCEGIGGILPIIKSKEEDQAMLQLLNGYVSILALIFLFLLFNILDSYSTSKRRIIT